MPLSPSSHSGKNRRAVAADASFTSAQRSQVTADSPVVKSESGIVESSCGKMQVLQAMQQFVQFRFVKLTEDIPNVVRRRDGKLDR